MNEGRHGTGFALSNGYLYVASGCGNRGGEPELYTIERLKLPADAQTDIQALGDQTPVYAQWHAVTLSFQRSCNIRGCGIQPFLELPS